MGAASGDEDGVAVPLDKAPAAHAVLLAQAAAQRVVQIEELVVDRVVGDLDVSFPSDLVEQRQDRVGVFPAVNVPDGAVQVAQVAQLVVAQHRAATAASSSLAPLLGVALLILVVKAHVDHHVDGVGHVAVQVGVPALFDGGVHSAPSRVATVGVVHFGAEVGRHVLAREVLCEIEHAVAVRVLREGERLHQVGVVLGHLTAEVLVGRPVL